MAFKLSGLSSKNKKSSDDTVASDDTIMESDIPDLSNMSAGTVNAKPISERLRFPMIVLGLLIFATAVLVYMQARQADEATLYVASAGEMQTLSQQIAKAAQLAQQGHPDAFTELGAASDRFSTLLTAIAAGGIIDGSDVPASPSSIQPYISTIRTSWDDFSTNVRQVVSQKNNLITLNQSVAKINESNALMLSLTEDIANIKLQANANVSEIDTANRAAVLTQRIAKNANALLISSTVDPEVSLLLERDSKMFNGLLTRLQEMPSNNNAIKEKLQTLQKLATETSSSVQSILDNVYYLVEAKKAGTKMFKDSSTLLQQSRDLSNAYDGKFRGLTLPKILIVAFAAIAALLLIYMLFAYKNDISSRSTESERQRREAENERNLSQQAILRLMNELGDLADGDLTIRTTVTEDITGAIADSVNYTIEELSVLVRRINDAASRVTSATESAQQTSKELLEATERQSREIEEVGVTVQRMAQSMSESSKRALQSAQVARRSLDSAEKGAAAVSDTIKGMNEIREQIQETSKRIKRLGESSQEIGEIVELISDITEQTNVLALNAAIQAASAGDAGRGFTVVAEEVQRLAERSAEATKQIAAIVKTIQTDTKDAVGAMEAATRDVVDGTLLSDAAGQALAEIGEVSNETAHLIEQISGDTQNQAATAIRVAETMKDILAVTEQTTRGTQQTAVSIGELADLAVELKGSVSGFKV